VTRRADGPASSRAAGLVLALLLAAGPLAAQDWHEAYRAGLAALARGDHARAAEALRRAARLRPEPGRNVVTYGTNVEPRYFPYLRLAEACLALEDLEGARQALDTSASWNREPADEREKLRARLDASVERRRPPAPTPTPAPVTTTVTTVAPAPPATSLASPPVTIAPATPMPTPARPATATPSPAARPRPQPAAPAPTTPPPESPADAPAAAPPTGTTGAGTLEIVSQPPGAAAYLDDEPVGSTDPETGRLVKTGLPPGRHRVRVAHAGHEDAVREVEVPPVGSATFYATLKPLAETPAVPRAALVAIALLAIALVALSTWIALRRPAGAPASIWAPTPRAGPTPRSPAVGSSGTPPGMLSPGTRRDEHGQDWFGDFRLLEMLGRGGMASVFKAERRSEVLALKRPLGSFLDDPGFLERFLREAEIGRTLNHPNIVRILERGDVEGVPYFTMELVAGETLQAFIRSWGAAAPRTAASIVAQVGEALDFAHGKGVIHRDLKPSNIMLLLDESAKVMDFGIARARRFDLLTATGAFLGTPDYVAPEMIEGRGSEARSDLYALGVVFFELLTGQRPFSGDTPFAVLKKHCTEEPPPPSLVHPGVPPDLDAIALRLLAKRPEERPESAEELVVALRDWLNRAA